jgi:hypothetical protein
MIHLAAMMGIGKDGVNLWGGTAHGAPLDMSFKSAGYSDVGWDVFGLVAKQPTFPNRNEVTQRVYRILLPEAILDGHIVLSRKLANHGHYPAIDILQSISRVQKDVIDRKHRKLVTELIDIYATYIDAEDLINIGAYVKGSNPRIDRAINRIDSINSFLRQDINEFSQPEETLTLLEKAVGGSV